jgi:hypothetical protein
MDAIPPIMPEISETNTDFYLGPGASVFYPIDMFFVGADLRFLIVLADESLEGLSIMVTGGVTL